MQELINSIVRLSAAATLYSMQQVQTSVTDFDTKESIQSLMQVMDGVTKALVSRLDDGKKGILDNISETSTDVAQAIERDIKEIRSTADDVMHRTLKATRQISHIGTHRAEPKAEEKLSAEKRGEVKPMSSVKKAASGAKKASAKAPVAAKSA